MPGHVRAACDGQDSVFHDSSGCGRGPSAAAAAPCDPCQRVSGALGSAGGRAEAAGTHLGLPGLHSTRAAGTSNPNPSWAAKGLPIFWCALTFLQFLEKHHRRSGLWALAPGVPSTRGPLPCSQLRADLGHSDSHWVSTNAHPIKEALHRTPGSITTPVRNALPPSGVLGALSR